MRRDKKTKTYRIYKYGRINPSRSFGSEKLFFLLFPLGTSQPPKSGFREVCFYFAYGL